MSTKEVYIEKLEAQLKEWSAKIDVLEAKAEKAEADTKIKYQEMCRKFGHVSIYSY